MRATFSIVFVFLVAAMGTCIYVSHHSHKSIGKQVAVLLSALLPPVIGNLVIVISSNQSVSSLGYYSYFLGMDLVMYAMLQFMFAYCHLSWPSRNLKKVVYLLLCIDVIQYAFNPFFHHAFTSSEVIVDGLPYWRLVPLAGQTYHRIVDYGIFFSVIAVFCYKFYKTSRYYSERYSVILLAMLFGGAWQSYYIFSGTPVDKSMIGFAIFGILVFYLSLYHRPMRLLDRMLANIASEIPEALYFYDAAERCIWTNNPGMKLAGTGENEFETVQENLEKIFGSVDIAGPDWSRRQELGIGDDIRYYQLSKYTLFDERNRRAGSFLSIRDNTEEQRAVQKELYNAKHDVLTGLYTREYLYERIREMIRDHPDILYDIIFVDVKDFKLVNDIFGSQFGDYALKCIARMIEKDMPGSGVYGRLSGDTFGICIPEADFDARQMTNLVSDFIVKDHGIEHRILIHLGVFAVTERELDVSVMFDRAHLALSTIKDEYQTHLAYYDEDMRNKVLWIKHISEQVEEAIATRQIQPYLQPIVDHKGKVVGAEALVRWIHPVDGFMVPSLFIPVFEKNGMIAEVDKYMWRCACEILSRWNQEGKDMFLSVNISPKDFCFMDVESEIKNIVKDFDINPAKLRIEITETIMMTDIENRMRILYDLKEAGFIVEMDDFGSGYSSLNMLKDMPVDVLKIDMAFLKQTKDEQKAQTIVNNIIHLSDDLSICSLTEGVETLAQYHMLSAMGCKLFQGYYFAKPLPVDEFERICFEEDTLLQKLSADGETDMKGLV